MSEAVLPSAATGPIDHDAFPIVVEGLRNQFGDHVIHDDLSLTVRRGEVLGVVGGSGTGNGLLLYYMSFVLECS